MQIERSGRQYGVGILRRAGKAFFSTTGACLSAGRNFKCGDRSTTYKCLRSRGRNLTLGDRFTKHGSSGQCIEYSPLHYPEQVPIARKLIQAYSARKVATEIDELLATSTSQNRIVCYDSPGQYPLVGRIGATREVYLAIDDRTLTVTGKTIDGEVEAERRLLQRVDQVVCVSHTLAETLKARAGHRNNLRVDVLTNGYDETLFNTQRQWQEPEELRDVPRPRILVSGHVSERIDWDGIYAACELRPTWSWVFIGPADVGMSERVASIRTPAGAKAFLFPPVHYESVPAWIAHCDVCAVPYRLNKFTLASSPLKAIEYLGVGAPVLSTRIPSVEPFGEVISWVAEGNGQSYAYALDYLARQERSGAAAIRREEAVRSENWHYKTQQFCELVGPL